MKNQMKTFDFTCTEVPFHDGGGKPRARFLSDKEAWAARG